MSDLYQALLDLKRHVAQLEFSHRLLKASADDAIEKLRLKWSKSRNKSIDSFGKSMDKLKEVHALRSYEQSMKAELRGAIEVGLDLDSDLVNCRRLAESMEGGLFGPEPYGFTFDARIELDKLLCKLDSVSDAGSASVVSDVLRKFLPIWKSRKSYADAGARMAESLSDDDYEAYKAAKSGRRITSDKKEHFTKLAKNWKENGLPENLK